MVIMGMKPPGRAAQLRRPLERRAVKAPPQAEFFKNLFFFKCAMKRAPHDHMSEAQQQTIVMYGENRCRGAAKGFVFCAAAMTPSHEQGRNMAVLTVACYQTRCCVRCLCSFKQEALKDMCLINLSSARCDT